jgi:predicted nucleotidyltransferase
MTLSFDKEELARIAKKHRLRFVILHGSYATGKDYAESDVDIAVVPAIQRAARDVLALFGPLSLLFKAGNRPIDLDLKSMEGTDPLFRYEVTRDGVLLFGNPADYEEYKAISARMYDDARPLFALERLLVHRYQRYLNSHSHA